MAKVKCLFIIAVLAFSATTINAQSDCSFNTTGTLVSLCNLLESSDPFAVVSWRGGLGTESNWRGGPPADNQDDPNGGYGLVTNTDILTSDAPHKKAWLVTDAGPSTGALGKCVEFAYASYGLSIEQLQVLLITYTIDDVNDALQNDSLPVYFKRTNLWKTAETTRGQWTSAHVSFSAQGEYSIGFEVIPSTHYRSYTGYVAVDDITFKDGPCDNECTFDLNFCDWTNVPNDDDFDWSLGRGSDKRNTGPSTEQAAYFDPTITIGGYTYIDSSYPRMDGEVAQLSSPPLDPTEAPMCLKFWLNMHGSGLGFVRVLYSPTGTNDVRELWKQYGPPWGTDDWYPGQVTVSSTEPFNLIFEASIGSRGAGDIALDTITYNKGACPSQPSSSTTSWGDCTFLQDSCNWEIPYIPDEPCTMLSRVHESDENPPGHTVNDFGIRDYYIQYDLSCYQQQPRHTVDLMSGSVEITTETCLSFWVFMFTRVASQNKIGALSVVLISNNGNVTLWRLENEQQAEWTYSQVTIPAVGPAKVIFQGTKASSVIGMIGLDDITIFNSACEVLPEQARVDVADCAFDHGLCAWTIQNQDPLADRPSENWRFATRDISIGSGLRDHTFDADGGGFLYVDVFSTDIVTRLRSPNNLEKNATYCLTFYFAVLFPDSGAELSVVKDLGSTQEIAWQVEGNSIKYKMDEWYHGRVELDAVEDGFMMYFEAKVREGGFALDDIKLSKTSSNCRIRPEFATQGT